MGVKFHWYVQDYLSFDLGSRESVLVEYKSDEQFAKAMHENLSIAEARVSAFRDGLSHVDRAGRFILKFPTESTTDLWRQYHEANACALMNDSKGCLQRLRRIQATCDGRMEWQARLKLIAVRLEGLLKAGLDAYREELALYVSKARMKMKLEEAEFRWDAITITVWII